MSFTAAFLLKVALMFTALCNLSVLICNLVIERDDLHESSGMTIICL